MSYDNHAMFYMHGLICSQKGFYLNFKTKLVGTKGANAPRRLTDRPRKASAWGGINFKLDKS
ncbi:hypothetical protein B8W99_05860 [Peribacillus simplex]|nr:hypothetical protein B8W99_05860 [Peribacillus simplex]